MDFLSQTARQQRIPRPIAKDAATVVLALLQRFAKPEQVAQLVREVPLARELLGESAVPERKSGIGTWISEMVAAVATGSRAIRGSLKATGLRDAEIEVFLSAVVQHTASQTGREFVAQLVHQVPGLARLVTLPQGREADQ